MNKIFTVSLIFFLTVLFFNTEIKAQTTTYDLKFSRAIIVGSGEQTVPPNTVWKVTSIYGEEINICIPVFCVGSGNYAKGIVSSIHVNGIMIPSTLRGFKTNMGVYGSNNCVADYYSGYDVSCANKTSDPNILPLWLPAGTTLKSGGPNTFVSIIEFVLQ